MVDKVLTCLCLISMLSNASFSLIAPFYPLKVKEKESEKEERQKKITS